MNNEEIISTLVKIQPLYDKLNSRFSKSYLKGSLWYVGDDLVYWWNHCNTVRYFEHNVKKIMIITEILKTDMENEISMMI